MKRSTLQPLLINAEDRNLQCKSFKVNFTLNLKDIKLSLNYIVKRKWEIVVELVII